MQNKIYLEGCFIQNMYTLLCVYVGERMKFGDVIFCIRCLVLFNGLS